MVQQVPFTSLSGSAFLALAWGPKFRGNTEAPACHIASTPAEGGPWAVPPGALVSLPPPAAPRRGGALP